MSESPRVLFFSSELENVLEQLTKLYVLTCLGEVWLALNALHVVHDQCSDTPSQDFVMRVGKGLDLEPCAPWLGQ